MKKLKVSINVIRRLPRYLRKLDELSEAGIGRISSSELGQLLGLTPSQIRQDFSCFGEFGQQGYGYNVPVLRGQIASILGVDRNFTAILVGVGNIGHALMENLCFDSCGCKLKCAFDINPKLVGSEFHGVPVYHMEELDAYLKENAIDIAVLSVAKEEALKAADILVANNVGAIWNFSNADIIETGSSTLVENVHFADSLLTLSYFVAGRQAQ